MMQYAIDRSAQTGRSFAVSTAAHVLGLLLLAVLVGREAAEVWTGDELTEIAYIEARYGEDVAKKVKLKALKPPGPAGPGITTDSAMKRSEPELAVAPEPEAAAAPTLTPADPKTKLAAPPKLEPQRAPVERPQLAAAVVTDMAPVSAPVRELAQAVQLDARAAPAPQHRVIDMEKLNKSLAGEVNDTETSLPRRARPTTHQTFKPQNSGLRDRGGRAPVGSEPVVAAAGTTGRTRGAVAGADAGLAGGGLNQRTRPAGTPSSTRPTLSRGSTGIGGGIADITGPSGASSGSPKGARKTILDYGNGSGGGSGGLVGRRGRMVEPSVKRGITADAGSAEPQTKRVAEAKLDNKKGVGMTITGQIAGRKILSQAAPTYSDLARSKGWEGAVAVHFTVLPDGRVKDNVYFEQTSVHRDLNQAAMAAIRKFRFAPLPKSQSAVEQWGVITIVFRLN